MATIAKQSKLSKLREPFPAEQVKQRRGGGNKQLDYVPIETMLERLLEVAPEYTWSAKTAHVQFVDGQFGVVVQGGLEIDGKFASGFGAMVNPDPDMAVKSANSEAMKNAMKNGWGISLELWSEEHREKLGRDRRLAGGDLTALKSEVFELAKKQLGVDKPSVAQVAAAFNVQPGNLADPVTLRMILEREGAL